MIILELSAEQQELCEIKQQHCMSVTGMRGFQQACGEHRAKHAQHC